jgi:cytosine/creatinine deaminase
MLVLRRARVPAALLPPALAGTCTDSLEPSVLCDISIVGDRVATVSAAAPAHETTPPEHAAQVLDLDGALVLPGLVDAHVHLDKAHTWNRAPNRSATFWDALETLARDKVNWTASDLRRRAEFALRCAWAHGTRVVRTHVDTWLPHGEVSHAVMAELRERWRGRITLQTVPLCPIDNFAQPLGAQVAELALRYGASALGGFAVMSAELPRQFDGLLAIARERGIGLDLHVDENGNPESECLRLLAEAVLRAQFPHPVVCGHCCSLAVQPPERQRATIELVKAAGLRVISLPMCNLYLQDRRGAAAFPRSPHWRGLTLVHELLDAGVPVACASDNVRDAFFAYGDFDLLEVYAQSVRLAHLDTRLAESVGVVTSTAAGIVGLPEYGRVAPGAPAHLVLCAAHSFSELLSRPAAPRRLVDGETVQLAAVPDYRELS